jgi:hypothetical protein
MCKIVKKKHPMNSPFEQVFSQQIDIDNHNSFQVSFFITKGKKVDSSMLAYQFLEIRKLSNVINYTYVRQPAGFDGKLSFVLSEQSPQVTWPDEVNKQLFHAINNIKIPSQYINDRQHFSGII